MKTCLKACLHGGGGPQPPDLPPAAAGGRSRVNSDISMSILNKICTPSVEPENSRSRLHTCLLNSENPIQTQTQTFIKRVLLSKVRAINCLKNTNHRTRKRGEQRFVLNRIVADLQVFLSGSNIRGVADITEIMATGKRSQVVIIEAGKIPRPPALIDSPDLRNSWGFPPKTELFYRN
ncbi:unnamed protein product [Porites lobata]|uniref:Uncharacterized protein n=1 Tax=Porites lobata TaxID=104759 RepID=A0ABN8RFQ4_9CNID|nr:unnamed protein product [Porites lobata]